MAQKNPSVQYYAGVGVNAYVSVHLSFLPETQRRSTRAVARTFCPEFEHHVEFLCNLIVQRSSGEASCLGELLQSANIVFSIYHQSTKSGEDKLFCWLNAVTEYFSPSYSQFRRLFSAAANRCNYLNCLQRSFWELLLPLCKEWRFLRYQIIKITFKMKR